MEKRLRIIYNIISLILVPVIVLFILTLLTLLPAALKNPGLLLSSFIFLTVILYSFSSYRFFRHGVVGGRNYKKGFRDFIRVNAIVTLLFCGLSFVQSISIFFSSAIQADFEKALLSMMQQYGATLNSVSSIIHITLILTMTISILFFIHVLLSFYFIKKYKTKFVEL